MKRSGSALVSALMLLIAVGVICATITVCFVQWRSEYVDVRDYLSDRIQ